MSAETEAEQYKNEANKFFQAGKFDKALDLYDRAIDLNPYNAIYFANRSFANLKLENTGSAIKDAMRSIDLDNTYAKGYYRKGSAEIALGKWKDALRSFRAVVKLYPSNKEATEKLTMCEKIVRRMAFEAAIEVSDTPVSETIDLESMVVEQDYKGPHMPTPITLEFVKQLMEDLKAQKKLHTKYLYQLLLEAKKVLSASGTLIEAEVPQGHFNVCGDTHGQFYDLLNIFEVNGMPSETNPYLFNGDFVDRGSFSVEVIVTLLALKVLYPNHFYLTRGNHETLNMNNIYGFRSEVEAKYNKRAFDLFTEVFNYLPLAAVINKKVFVVHGGLFSKDGVTLDDIKKVDRVRQPPDEGIFCEMLWSDPQQALGRAPNKRGVGVAFGPDITKKFLEDNKLELIIRSHEVKDEGYQVEADGKLITIFSAPNYCDQMGNKGAIVKLDANMKPSFVQFTAVPHPPIKPMAYSNQFQNFL